MRTILKTIARYTKKDLLHAVDYAGIEYSYSCAEQSRYDLGVQGLCYFDKEIVE